MYLAITCKSATGWKSLSRLAPFFLSFFFVVVVVTGGGFFLACEDFGRMFDNSLPGLRFFFLSGDYLAHTKSTLSARISPQWLTELRRL